MLKLLLGGLAACRACTSFASAAATTLAAAAASTTAALAAAARDSTPTAACSTHKKSARADVWPWFESVSRDALPFQSRTNNTHATQIGYVDECLILYTLTLTFTVIHMMFWV